MSYGRAICAICSELIGGVTWTCCLRDCNVFNRDDTWMCYLRDLCDLKCDKWRCLTNVRLARFVRFVMSRASCGRAICAI